MSFYRTGTLIKRKEGKLQIFKKLKKYNTENYYGRFFIEGKQVEKSSKSSNKEKAIKLLGQIYEDYHSLKRLGQVVHSKTLADCWKLFVEDLKKGTFKSKITTQGYLQKGKLFVQHMGKLKVDRITYDDLKDYLTKRMGGSNRSDKLRNATLRGDLRTFSIFDTWCVQNGHKKKKLSSLLKQILGKGKEDTSRTYFDRDEYQKLLTTSKKRIKQAEQGGLDGGKRVAFNRKLLHQFIIFAVNTGIRTGGILNLKWEDVSLRDKRVDYLNKGIEKNWDKNFFNQLDRYYTFNNVKDKSGIYKNIGLGGSYFAIESIKKLYKEYDKVINQEDRIFNVKSFSVGFNSLLDEAGLKYEKRGNDKLRRDSVSLRHTYIVFQLQNNISDYIVGKNVGTSGKMIYENYSKHLKTIELVDRLTGVNQRRHIRLVSIK